ncbi:MAG: site-specific integrase [Dechloromonas sp.]|nr:MAG: site-specific integrase [Dechloromonas sp.]
MGTSFEKVHDYMGRRVRGLWQRNGKFYQQLLVEQPDGQVAPRRILLKSTTLDNCRIEMAQKRGIRDQGEAASEPLEIPSFAVCCRRYFDFHESLKHGLKRQTTIDRERWSLNRWQVHFGHLRVNQVTRVMINGFMQKRLRGGRNPRTVNIDLINLRQVLKYARDCGFFTDQERLPTEGVKPLRYKAPVRPLLKDEQFGLLCEKADSSANRSGPILADFIRFLGFSGGRYKESLRLKWKDVSFELRQVTFGSDGLSKNGKARVVDFNPALEAHLRIMHARRAPDCKYLFPSPQRGGKDIPASDLRGSLFAARAEADLEWVGFHDLRHFFASYCVMSGIDFKTIAEWLGHESGTALIDKVYGHLAADHKRRMAQKVSFSLAQQAASPAEQPAVAAVQQSPSAVLPLPTQSGESAATTALAS